MIHRFADCELDERLCELRCGGEPRHVEPQVFDVLLHLVRNPDRVVSRDELLDEIWGHRFVTPATVSARIKSARKAVGDDGTRQRVIRTVRGRGFRLVVPVERSRAAGADVGPAPEPTAETRTGRSLVARTAELDDLRERLRAATAAGARQLVLVSGESGIGKTTLATALADAARDQGVLVGVGRSIEQGGVGEPYLPVLDALGRLMRGSGRTEVLETLRDHAPTWLAQMPSHLGPDESVDQPEEGAAATRERMLREIVDGLEALCMRVPVLILLEDLHWADRSTLDLLLWLALREEPARLFVLVTYRTGAVGEELRALVRKLRRNERSHELTLGPWDVRDVGDFLAERFPEHGFPADLPALMLDRSAGNPLFVKSLADQWIERGDLVEGEGGWRLAGELDDLGADLPSSLHDAVEQQVDTLEALDLEILEAASCLGSEFTSAVVAAMVGRADEDIERRCDDLARTGPLVVPAGATELPDGSVSARFTFAHDLYREALYGRIPPQRRVRLHARAGDRLERAYASEAAEHAGELALHFVRGREADRAIPWLTLAAGRALMQSAHHEAVTHIESALHLLRGADASRDALERELVLQQMLGPARLEIGGWDDPDAERAYNRAKEIAVQLEDSGNVGRALYGLAYLHEVRGEYGRAQAALQERLALCEARPDPWGSLEAHDLLGCSLFHVGHFRDAMESARLAVESPAARRLDDDFDVALHHPAVSCRYWAGTLHWFLGRPDTALAMVSEARDLATTLGHVPTLVFTEARKARIHHFRREIDECRRSATRALRLAEEHGLPYQRSVALTLVGWADALGGDPEGGIARIREGLAFQRESGTVMDYPYGLALLAEARLAGGQCADALDVIDRALSDVDARGGAFFWTAELLRLRGVALQALERPAPAERALREAVSVAVEQGSPSLELRALVSLAEAQAPTAGDAGRDTTARIGAVLGTFAEGRETADLSEAGSVLARLAGAGAAGGGGP